MHSVHRRMCLAYLADTSSVLLLLLFIKIKTFQKQEIRSMERVSAQYCCIPYTVIDIFDCNCNDPELGRFKVIQGQR